MRKIYTVISFLAYAVISILTIVGATLLTYAYHLQVRYNELSKARSFLHPVYVEEVLPFMETYDTYFVPCVVLGAVLLCLALGLGCLVIGVHG